MNILYIHGFLSSPASHKARATQAFLQSHYPQWQFVCPALPSYPEPALWSLEELVSQWADQPCGIIGSSLGGYFANILTERYGFRSVLVNPSVTPWGFAEACIGQTLKHYYSDEEVQLKKADVSFLKKNMPKVEKKLHYWLLAQEGDETLDYRDAAAKFAGCYQTVLPNGNHSFEGYEAWLPKITQFLEYGMQI